MQEIWSFLPQFLRIIDLKNDCWLYIEKQMTMVRVGGEGREGQVRFVRPQRDPIGTYQNHELNLHVACLLCPLTGLPTPSME